MFYEGRGEGGRGFKFHINDETVELYLSPMPSPTHRFWWTKLYSHPLTTSLAKRDVLGGQLTKRQSSRTQEEKGERPEHRPGRIGSHSTQSVDLRGGRRAEGPQADSCLSGGADWILTWLLLGETQRHRERDRERERERERERGRPGCLDVR